MTRISADRLLWAAVGAVVLVRLGLSLHEIDRPGLYYDEVLFVNAATEREPGLFLDRDLFGFPVTVFPYIGALKSYLWAPIFAIFGTDATSIRFPAALLATAGIVLVFAGVRQLVNTPVALLSLVALSFDGTLFWLTRNDAGPNAPALFLKGFAIYAIARWARTKDVRWLAALLVALALGVWDKLNFIWLVNALVVASAILAWHHRQRLREYQVEVAVWIGGLAVIYAGWAAWYVGRDVGGVSQTEYSGSLLGFTWPQLRDGTELVLSGSWFYNHALSTSGSSGGVVLIFLGLFAAGSLAATLWRPARNALVAGMSLVVLITCAQILITPEATAGWHYIAIQPMITVVSAYGAYALGQAMTTVLRGPAWISVAAVALAGLLVVGHDYRIMRRHFDALDHEPRHVGWTPAIYDLDRYVQGHAGTFFTADWGIHNSLFALHQDARVRELAFTVAGAPAEARTIVARESGPRYVVLHAANREVFTGTYAKMLGAGGRHLRRVRVIHGLDRLPVFEIYRWR